jgi:hypothetical protein
VNISQLQLKSEIFDDDDDDDDNDDDDLPKTEAQKFTKHENLALEIKKKLS